MSIELSRFAQQKLAKKKYVPVVTSFITQDGPAVGTIWFNDFARKNPPLIVKEIRNRNGEPSCIVFDDGSKRAFRYFMHGVEAGEFILIGVTPEPWSHTEI